MGGSACPIRLLFLSFSTLSLFWRTFLSGGVGRFRQGWRFWLYRLRITRCILSHDNEHWRELIPSTSIPHKADNHSTIAKFTQTPSDRPLWPFNFLGYRPNIKLALLRPFPYVLQKRTVNHLRCLRQNRIEHHCVIGLCEVETRILCSHHFF